MTPSRTASALLLPLLLLACASRTARVGPRPPAPDTAPPSSWTEAPGGVLEASSVEVLHQDAHAEIRKILLPPRLPPDLETFPHAREPIEIVHFRPRPLGGTPRPLVLMQPILGNDMTLMPEFARGFTRLGYHAAVVKRMDFTFRPETAMEDAETEFRLLVMRARQALDWLAAQPEVDGARLATFGVSAGAILSACVAGADPRPKAHVLVLAGGPLADVLLDTKEDRFRRYGEKLNAETGWTDDEIRERLRAALRTDPVRLAPRVPREEVLLFVARHDESVPTRYGLRLWRALGEPELRVLPFDHYLSFLCLPWIQAESNAFLRARLGPP